MKVHFERSGGFAGRKVSADFDEPADSELGRLVQESRFFETRTSGAHTGRGADRFQYTVAISDGGKDHTVRVADGEIPEGLQPLIEYLVKASRP
jgi:hypothetical protein